MHEISLFQGFIKQIDQIANEHAPARVKTIHIRLGAFSNISPGHFKEHFYQVAPGTAAEGAKLDIVTSDDPLDIHALDMMLESVELETVDERSIKRDVTA